MEGERGEFSIFCFLTADRLCLHGQRSKGNVFVAVFALVFVTVFVYSSSHTAAGRIEVAWMRGSSNPVAKLQQKPNDLTMNAASPPLLPGYTNIVDVSVCVGKKRNITKAKH